MDFPQNNNGTDNDDVGNKTKQGLIWTAIFNSIQYVIRFASSIILARLLFPEDFGLMGLAMIALQFARRLSNFGFGTVLIQRKDVDREHFDTVFFFNAAIMFSITAILIAASPYLAKFFHNDKLGPVLAVVSFDFTIKAFLAVPYAILSREMRFKELEISRTVSHAMMLVAPVILALLGFGVWSLVVGNLLSAASYVGTITFFARWYPRFRFNYAKFKQMFSFGAWIYVDNFIAYAINNVDYFLIGKFMNATQLGFYERAFNLMSLPRKRIIRNVNQVLLSAYSRIQDDNAKISSGLDRVFRYLAFVSYPLMVWLYFVAPSFITVLYGPKWTSTIFPLQIMCASGLLQVFAMGFKPVLTAKAAVGAMATRRFIYLVILTVSIYIGIDWGIDGVATGVAISSVFYLLLLFQATKTRVGYSFKRFLLVQKSTLIYSGFQIAALLALEYLSLPYISNDSWQMLILVSVLSVGVFIGAHMVFRFKDIDGLFKEFLGEIKKFAKKIKKIKKEKDKE